MHLRTICLLAGLTLVPTWGWAATFTVDTTTDSVDTNPGDGTCSDGSACSLRAAVMEANALSGEDTIEFDPSLAGNPIELTIGGLDESYDATDPANPVVVDTPDASVGDLDITDTVAITGLDPDAIDDTHIVWASDATTPDRIFQIQATTASISATIENLAIGDGRVASEDIPDTNFEFRRRGGALAIGVGASIVDTTVSGGDVPEDPGGEEGEAGVDAVTLQRILVHDSSAGGDAGGIYNGAPLTLLESVISGNTSSANGGGLYNDAGALVRDTLIGSAADLPHVSDSTLYANGNNAENGGGVFDTGFHTTRIEQSAVNGNSAIGGGGIAARSLVAVDIENSTVSGNTATDVGGGITTNGSVNLLNATVVNNSATTDAPGGGAGLNSFGDGTYSFGNTIIAGNEKTGAETTLLSNCGASGGSEIPPAGTFESNGHNIEDGDSCSLTATGDLPTTDPTISSDPTSIDPDSMEQALTPFHFLLTGSPAIDAGDDANCPNNDQRGAIRPGDGDNDGAFICDIGAYEGAVQYQDLHINNLVAPDRVNVGDNFEVTVEVHNTDPSATATATTLDVSHDAGIAVSAADATTGTCTIDGPGNSVSCNLGDLGTGAQETVTLTASAASQAEYGIDASVATTNAAANDTDPAENDSVSATVRAIGTADLGLSASADASRVKLNRNVTLSFQVENAGPDDATAVRLAGAIPPQASFVSATADNGGTCANLSGTVVCELGNLPLGGPVVNVDVVLKAVSKGDATASAAVEAEQTDPNESDNTVSATVRFVKDSSDGVFGCTLDPGAPLDPLLVVLLLAAVGWVVLRHRRSPGED